MKGKIRQTNTYTEVRLRVLLKRLVVLTTLHGGADDPDQDDQDDVLLLVLPNVKGKSLGTGHKTSPLHCTTSTTSPFPSGSLEGREGRSA